MAFYPQPYAARGRGATRGNFHNHNFAPYGRGQGRGAPYNENDVPTPRATPKPKPIEIDGVTFKFILNNSKLKRITPPDPEKPTPLKFAFGSVMYYRTKGGNLLRSKEYKELEEKLYGPVADGGSPRLPRHSLARKKLCPRFTRTGLCTARSCANTHDPSKLAACKSYLHKRECAHGSSCALSHDLTPQRNPICLYFLRGHCTNRACQYVHALPKEGGATAPVCDSFARLGFCELGASCAELHVFECPDFSNRGNCDAEKCPLPHVQRAGALQRRLNGSNGANASPLSSNKEPSMELEDDGPKVGFFEDFTGSGHSPVDKEQTNASAFAEQEDFIRL